MCRYHHIPQSPARNCSPKPNTYMKTSAIQQDVIELDARELFGDLLAGVEEQAVGKLHDVGLVHGGDAVAAHLRSIGKGVAGAPLRRFLCDQFDRLHDAVDDLRLEERKWV
ncbi:hypothetical protein BC936DRAFT_141011 [Jimgerdemannia flammicorona]|uniref:Uncharacterized protein n=2 Tax=Jimgerdemannia flammicorona TaxID=994334 RepID=A0A433DMR3_9FUNG|nr:hypothetical protein BC936DRAFT_141011 [Jimgerdemannia flammicorona]RUS34638.1 hypothetical protein BC938DRAFT_479428 [Jimgerdemannia flammicorona]